MVLFTVSFAEAIPQGTVIKEGVLTYPAGPYLAKDPLLLGLDNYGGNNRAQISGNSAGNSGNLFFETAYSEKDHPHSEKECTYFAKSYNLNLKNLITANIRICLSDSFSI